MRRRGFLGAAGIAGVGAMAAPAGAAQAAAAPPGRRFLAADYSKSILAIVGPDGRTEWSRKVRDIHDAAVLPDGNVLFQDGWTTVLEADRDGRTVWRYDAATANGNRGRRVEVHAFQRLPDGSTMIAESGPARIIEVDRDGKLRHEVRLTVEHPNAHSDTRLARKLPTGNYLVAHEADGKAREYDPAGKVVWEYAVPLFGKPPRGGHGVDSWGNKLFSAVRLANGNTLVGTGNGHSVLEVTPAKEIAWRLTQDDLPGVRLAWVCGVARLANGNTFLVNCHAGPANPQLLEVTPGKRVAWSLTDHQRFGDATAVALLLP